MDYSYLVKYYKELESTTKRLEKIDILAKLFKETKSGELSAIVYLIQGTVFPEWDERNIGFSSRLILKSINSVTGISVDEIEKLWRTKGDLGLVTEELIKEKKQTTLLSKKLSVKKVFDNIRKLADLEGEGTVNKKIQLVSELLSNATIIEAKFIVKTILKELRFGVKEGVIRDSISKAFDIDVEKIEEAFNLTGDYGEIAELAKEGNMDGINIKVGKPLKLMLATLVRDVEDGFKSVGKPLEAEFKLDGFRVSAHKDKNNQVKLFTRRMEDVTKQFPDIISVIKDNIEAKEFILDCEVVGIDKNNGKYLPFQNISQRIRRKYEIEKIAKEFPVEVNVFDIIYYDGKNLMQTPLIERRDILEKITKEKKYNLVLTKKIISDNEKEINHFFKESLILGNEGLMLKNINSFYVPGRYVNGWCKLKNVLEPLDLTITRGFFGEGKRAGWLTSFTVACKFGDKFLNIGDVSTGLKEKKGEDVTYEQMTKILKPLIIEEKGKEVIVKPKIVIEVGYEEIQKSQTSNSGFSLRFPRFLKLREDKPLSEINTLNDIERIYKVQKGK